MVEVSWEDKYGNQQTAMALTDSGSIIDIISPRYINRL